MRKQLLNHLAIIASLSLITTTSAKTPHANSFSAALSPRQSTSCPSSFAACTSSGLPSDFCCPSTSTCITLASNTTLLCCPSGTDCSRIDTIVCELDQQNVQLHPDSTIKTTNLSGKMASCGVNRCCPFGFTCSGTGTTATCVMDKNQKLLPPSSSSSSSTTPPTTPSSSLTSSLPGTTDNPLTAQSTTCPTCPAFPIPAILAGLFPGLLAGILLSLTTFCLLGRARRHRAPKISSPTYQGPDFRTDFVRRYQPSTPGTGTGTSHPSAPATPVSGIQRVRSLFRKPSTAPPPTRGLGMGLPSSPSPQRPPLPTSSPKTGARTTPPQLRRDPSSESINIFADPSTAGSGNGNGSGTLFPPTTTMAERRLTTQTTFTDLMERADLRGVGEGRPFVPTPTPAPTPPVPGSRKGMGTRGEEGEGPRLSPARFSPPRGGSSGRRIL